MLLRAAAGAAAAGSSASVSAQPLPLRKPPRLQPGDTVGLFNPSTVATDTQIDKAVANVESLGLRVRLPANLRARHGKTAGTVAQRLADFHALWRDEEVQALWAVRGGSGAAALLPLIDLAMVRARPKAVIGYSDITALLLGLWRGAGLVGFHGPVATSTFSEYSLASWRKLLMDPQPETRLVMAQENLRRAETAPQFRPRTLRGGIAEGRLVGGNLSVLTALVGTPFAADFERAILFLEEIGEEPYRIDRLLTQLQQSQGLSRAAAVMCGVFEHCEPRDAEPSLSLLETLDEHLVPSGVTAVYGWSFGHIAQQMTLPIGVRARLDTAAGVLTLLEPAVT
jgi:muramoyltetrapeptide carboxypeptidase